MFSAILTGLTNFIGGSVFKEIKETVMSYFPPNMSPVEKAQMELKLQELLHNKQLEANRIIEEAGKQLDKRIAEQEGSAKELRTIPIIGHIVLFARGCQRPVWGFATLYMDFLWFFENYTFNEQQNTALIVINILVLGFLFGERTIQNLSPLIEKVFAKG